MNPNRSISTSELQEHIEKGARIIDVRPVDAYNGWKIAGEERGGHIPGSKSLPAKWCKYMDWIEIVRHKGITPDEELILYGYTAAESRNVLENFRKAGYHNLQCYDHFIREWSGNPVLPMEKLPNYRKLVPAWWIKNLTEAVRPPEYDNNRFIVVHCHYRHRDAYLSGHIPGAIDMDTNALESPETWNRRSPEELKESLEQHGITADTTVIVYGKFMFPDNEDEFPGSAAGDIGAIRCAFLMIYAGVKDVRVLNGGFTAWEDAGYEVSHFDLPKEKVRSFGSNIPANPDLAIDIDEAKEILQAENAELVCVRSYREYIGAVSGYHYIEKKGRIPGAIFADCGSDAYHMENYRNVDHTTREYAEVKDVWLQNGITPGKRLAFYCGTGWRGSEAWFNAWLLGWPRIAVFDGGWFEWSKDPENPYETGVPAEMKSEKKS